MRARLTLYAAGIDCEVREISLKDKPQQLLDISAKATVPVLLLSDGRVIDESLEIMLWALSESDPKHWLEPASGAVDEMLELIGYNDLTFKLNLDRYKYPQRFKAVEPAVDHFRQASLFLAKLDLRLQQSAFLFGPAVSLADVALFPFVRKFAAVDLQAFEVLPFDALQRWLSYWLADERFHAIMVKYPIWQPQEQPFSCLTEW